MVPPDVNYIHVNFHASFLNGRMVISVVARNQFRTVIWEKSTIGHSLSPLTEEAEAVKRACLSAAIEGWKSVIFEGDAQVLIKAIIGESQTRHWSIITHLRDIKTLTSVNNGWSFIYVPRQANSVAHELAIWALRNNSSGSTMEEELPNSCRSIIEMEFRKPG